MYLLNKMLSKPMSVSLNVCLSDLLKGCKDLERDEIKIFLECMIYERRVPYNFNKYSDNCILLVIFILVLIQEDFDKQV